MRVFLAIILGIAFFVMAILFGAPFGMLPVYARLSMRIIARSPQEIS